MMKAVFPRLVGPLTASLLLTFAGVGCDEDEPETPPEQTEEAAPRPLRELVGDTFVAVPSEVEVEAARMHLGRRLFHDPILSGDQTIACSTCHTLDHGGAEPRAVSTGIGGQQGPINSPTVLNARYNFRQFWDGRAADLLEQAAGPVTNPLEMGGEWSSILERLSADASYVAEFTAVFGGEEPITQPNVLAAIVEYENYLVTPAPFDRWLGGDDEALDEAQQRGLRAFVETGCPTCHNGRNLGGTAYQRMGLVNNYFEERGGELTEADQGRFNVTGDEADRHRFKVPTLRNVALTSPYFHDGSEAELGGAVRTMAHVQLGQELSDEQIADIVAFLGALTGELPAEARMAATEPAEATQTEETPGGAEEADEG